MKEPLFTIGTVTTTFHAEMALDMSGESSAEYIERHASGDFGEITEEEIFQNQKVINLKDKKECDQVFSAYSLSFNDVIIWVVTRFVPKNFTKILKYQEYELLFFPKNK